MITAKIVGIFNAIVWIALGLFGLKTHLLFPKHHDTLIKTAIGLGAVCMLTIAFASSAWILDTAYVILLGMFFWFILYNRKKTRI